MIPGCGINFSFNVKFNSYRFNLFNNFALFPLRIIYISRLHVAFDGARVVGYHASISN